MDVSLDELIAGQKKTARSAKRGRKVEGAAATPAASAVKKDSIKAASKKPAERRRVREPARSAGPQIAAPIMVSRRLLESAESRTRVRRGREFSTPVRVIADARARPAQQNVLTEQERMKATNIKIITELDGVPTPIGPLRKFVEESSSAAASPPRSGGRRFQHQTTRLADRFR